MDLFASYVLLVGSLCFTSVFCYPDGKVSISCDKMLPIHGDYTPQTSEAPYSISVSHTTYRPGDQITVTLQANSGHTFKGFLLQARSVGGDYTVGSFRIRDPNSQGLLCDNLMNSAVSHTNSSEKSSLSVLWIAPTGSGHVRFRATFVKRFSEFWDQVESQIILPFQISSDTCGSEKFCVSHPPACNPAANGSCVFMSLVPATGGGFVFEMSAPSTGYVASGFSSDKVMGNDDMYMCVINTTGGIDIQHAFSTGLAAPTLSHLGTVEGIVTSLDNGVIKCSFVTRNHIATPHGKPSNFFHLFVTEGPLQNGRILKDPQLPFFTDEKVDIAKPFEVPFSEYKFPIKVKVHGALMLIAWMTTGSIGMALARYMKKAAKKPIFGKASWFQFHQWLMVLTLAATITAFVLGFVQTMGWSYRSGSHAVIGCIVMILAFFQPIIALFRPDPQHKWRFIFYWFHALLAFVTKVLAVATIFLGFQLIDNTPDVWLVKVMAGFFGWEILAVLILENLYPRQTDSGASGTPEKKIRPEGAVLCLYVLGNLAFLTALLVGIGFS